MGNPNGPDGGTDSATLNSSPARLSTTASEASVGVPPSTAIKLLTAVSSKMGESSTSSPTKSLPPNHMVAKLEDANDSRHVADSISASANHSPKDAGSTTVHYGTRSRNKPNRPNYAEDVEVDYENSLHINGNGNGGQGASSAMHIAQTQPSPASSATQKRVPPANTSSHAINPDQSSIIVTNTAANTALPATSTVPVNPGVNVSKKRKAAQNAAATILSAQTTMHTMSKRANAREHRDANTTLFSFAKTGAKLQKGKLIADNGTVFSVNDHVYLVCEPPGDPYYLGRLMEFRTLESDNPDSPVDALRINWVYRPRDVQRITIDSRVVFVTMHSDICPLTSLRGRCVVSHKSEIDDFDEYKSRPDHFYFSQVFDRFMHRYFEVIPTSQVINVPENVKKALDERWKFIIVEASRAKDYTTDAKRCKRCAGYCANNDSVDCAVCRNTFHMNCVQPPLLKKPSRGFAWACGPCSRAQEKKLEARRTPRIGCTPEGDTEAEEFLEEDEEKFPIQTTAATPEAVDDRSATEAETAHAKLWTMRYLGMHCRVEDALQYDDRAIYPRASSRLGIKHQAVVSEWYGRPVELVKPLEIKKKYVKSSGKKESSRLTKETLALIEAERASKAGRPKWVQDEPLGYICRGEDHLNMDGANTARLCFKAPTIEEASARGFCDSKTGPDKLVDAYMARAKKIAKEIGVKEYSLDFMDRALYILQENDYDIQTAIKHLKKTDPIGKWPEHKDQLRTDLRDPDRVVTLDEKKRFEEGVTKYGSELRLVRLLVKTLPHADVVRYWYRWKKTDKGKAIWGSFGGRRNTKKLKADKEAAHKTIDDIADNADDSGFDNDKIKDRAKKMVCKYCATRKSSAWRRAPGVSPGETVPGEGRGASRKEILVPALCDRCARLWRRYAIKWENMDEMMKKLTQVGSRSWKKKLDYELLKEIELASMNKGGDSVDNSEPLMEPTSGPEPTKKKVRLSMTDSQAEVVKKKHSTPAPVVPRAPSPPPPLEPTQPKLKQFPCFVCQSPNTTHDKIVSCRDCRLAVHLKCYGLIEVRDTKWSCDMCLNDRKDSSTSITLKDPASYEYNCILCPVHTTQRELVEVPKTTSHKKKTEREKVKEQTEKELAAKLLESTLQNQRQKGRPCLPREALKRTADNNWVHVMCALFLPDIKFSNAKFLEAAEGVPIARRNCRDKRCNICHTENGATIDCHAQGCHKTFHVMCAIQAGQKFGFDVTPVKSSRRDDLVVTLGSDSGKISLSLWCKEHSAAMKTSVHALNECVDDQGLTALQKYASVAKQADLTLTGTTRKANQLDAYTIINTDNRRCSTTGIARNRSIKDLSVDMENHKKCMKCNTDVSPKWWSIDRVEILPLDKAQDVKIANGFDDGSQVPEPSMHQEPFMSSSTCVSKLDDEMDGVVSTTSRPRTPSSSKNGLDTVKEYECHRCHKKALSSQSEVGVQINQDMEPLSRGVSPLQVGVSGAAHLHTLPLPNIPAQATTQGNWPIQQLNGSLHVSPPRHNTHPPLYAGSEPYLQDLDGNFTSSDAHVAPTVQPTTHRYSPKPPVPCGQTVAGPLAVFTSASQPSAQHSNVSGMVNGVDPHSPTDSSPVQSHSRPSESAYHVSQPYRHHPPPPPIINRAHNYSRQQSTTSHQGCLTTITTNTLHLHPPLPPISANPSPPIRSGSSYHGASNSASIHNILHPA